MQNSHRFSSAKHFVCIYLGSYFVCIYLGSRKTHTRKRNVSEKNTHIFDEMDALFGGDWYVGPWPDDKCEPVRVLQVKRTDSKHKKSRNKKMPEIEQVPEIEHAILDFSSSLFDVLESIFDDFESAFSAFLPPYVGRDLISVCDRIWVHAIPVKNGCFWWHFSMIWIHLGSSGKSTLCF